VTACVVDVPPDHPQAAAWVAAEARAAVGYSEAHYDAAGVRREPVLRLLPPREGPDELPLGPEDVLLVSGGGKGIAAECALALARATGARLALLGRSRPGTDAELAANLERMAAAGVHCLYVPADVSDGAAVRAAVAEVEAALGTVTAVLHGAGTNVPRLLGSLDEAAFLRTLAAKVQGARNLLAAVRPDRLRLLVTFGSIIARTGMRGEADYAVANDWLARLTEHWQAGHPHCRCLAVEWSVWSGVGMGQRLGRVDALLQQGITPIPPDEGVEVLPRLLSQQLPAARVVVSGRFGEPPTLQFERPDLPFLRFLERPRVYYPGVELVVEADLSAETDPYLDDHVLQGERLFPAVMGLEALAQVATALAGVGQALILEKVTFERPVVLPTGGMLTIRVAGLVRESGKIEVVLRSSQTAFQLDHFKATCRATDPGQVRASCGGVIAGTDGGDVRLPLEPGHDLYDALLFQRGRFRRLQAYRRLHAKECLAEVACVEGDGWFGRYLPPNLVLGDPGLKDAAIHAIQACIPHLMLLPVGLDRLTPGVIRRTGPCLVRAWEVSQQGDIYVYEVEIAEADGVVCERWEGLRLRRSGEERHSGDWAAPLLGPYLERQVAALVPGAQITVAVESDGASPRRERSDRALRRLLGVGVPFVRRPCGKPMRVGGAGDVSVAHAGQLTLAVAGRRPTACDLEQVTPRPAGAWRDLLGGDRLALAELIRREKGESQETAATRVWVAQECLKKSGAIEGGPLVLTSKRSDGWVLLSAGARAVVTLATAVRGVQEQVVLGMLWGAENEGL
jgi:enediyne polyketide synthase